MRPLGEKTAHYLTAVELRKRHLQLVAVTLRLFAAADRQKLRRQTAYALKCITNCLSFRGKLRRISNVTVNTPPTFSERGAIVIDTVRGRSYNTFDNTVSVIFQYLDYPRLYYVADSRFRHENSHSLVSAHAAALACQRGYFKINNIILFHFVLLGNHIITCRLIFVYVSKRLNRLLSQHYSHHTTFL